MALSRRLELAGSEGTTIKSARVDDLEIPLLPLDAQHRWTEASTILKNRVSETKHIIETAGILEGVAADFLRFGILNRGMGKRMDDASINDAY